MISLNASTFKWDFARLSPELRLAFLGRRSYSQISRLTTEAFVFRATEGIGPNLVLTLDELVEELKKLPVAEPYVIPTPSKQSPAIDPLHISSLFGD